MSVIGIDFGNENCYIAVARAGGIETIANDYSVRATPSYVGFGHHSRSLGVSAKNQQVTNVKNTVYGFKRLLGKKYRDPEMKKQLESLPYEMVEMSDQNIGVKVHYLDEDCVFNSQQITAMLFTKLKEIAESALKIKVNDCVISVPMYFTDAERRALLDAASIAGLNVLRLLNEPTAVALTYGFYKQDLPEDKPKNVAFVDMGHSALQVAICAFNKGKLKMLSAVSESALGGRVIDQRMLAYFAEEFRTRYKLDVYSNKRAVIRLGQECEKLKKQLSANPTDLPLNIECLMEDRDVNGRMGRDKLEELMADLLAKVEVCLVQVLRDAGLKPEEVDAVEVVGGSCRIPAIKKLVSKVFKKEASTTLNLDEAVARGCALQCAMLSPTFKVRDFSITDLQPYAIKLVWDANKSEEGEMEVFPQNHQVPFSKLLTFYRLSAFSLDAYYANPNHIPSSNSYIGRFTIKNVVPSANGETSKVKVKARVNLHGIFSISSATMLEKQQAPLNGENKESTEPMDVDQEASTPTAANGDVDAPMANNVDAEDQTQAAKPTDEPMPDASKADSKKASATSPQSKKSKKMVKSIDLDIEAMVYSLSRTELDNLFEREGKMVAQDKLEKERVDAKNSMEEYLYEMRAGLEESYKPYVTESDRSHIMNVLEETENWLYDEGENQTKSVYVARLDGLKKIGDPVVRRAREHTERQPALEELGRALQQVRKALDMYAAKDPVYDHLDAKEMEKVQQCAEEKMTFLDKSLGSLQQCPTYQDPPITVEQIRKELQSLESTVKPILSKPKPKVEPPPAEKGAGENSSTAPNANATPADAAESTPAATPTDQESKMEAE